MYSHGLEIFPGLHDMLCRKIWLLHERSCCHQIYRVSMPWHYYNSCYSSLWASREIRHISGNLIIIFKVKKCTVYTVLFPVIFDYTEIYLFIYLFYPNKKFITNPCTSLEYHNQSACAGTHTEFSSVIKNFQSAILSSSPNTYTYINVFMHFDLWSNSSDLDNFFWEIVNINFSCTISWA